MSSTRLALALTTSGILCAATQAGEYSFMWCAVLAPAPLLLAVRCLPLRVGVPIALLAGAVGRLVSARSFNGVGSTGHELAVAAVGGAALWLVPFLFDRVCATWLRRAGFLAFPAAAVVLARVGDAFFPAALAGQLHAPAHHATLSVWEHDLGRVVVEYALWTLASATSGLASVRNWFVPDPYTQDEREAGLRWGGVTGLFTFIALFGIGALRLRRGASTEVVASTSDAFVALCAALLVALTIAALVVRSRVRGAKKERA